MAQIDLIKVFGKEDAETFNKISKGYSMGEKDGIRKFAEKIKSHMMMYCQGRLEQQYCAMEVIDYIGKLMGDKDFSIDVEEEIAEHDRNVVREFAEWCKSKGYSCYDWRMLIEQYEKEQMKGYKN